MRSTTAGVVFLAAIIITCSIVFAGPFNAEEGERPADWQTLGGNEQAWRVLNGSLSSGNGDQEGYGNPSILYRDRRDDWKMTDYVVRATVKSHQENGTFQLLARFQDPENYYALEYRDRTRMERVRLTKVKDGEIQYNRTVGHGFRYDNEPIPDMHAEPVRLALEVRGNLVRATVNGGYALEIEDEDFPRGTVGLGTFFYDVDILSFAVLDPEAAAAADIAAAAQIAASAEIAASSPDAVPEVSPEGETALAEADADTPDAASSASGAQDTGAVADPAFEEPGDAGKVATEAEEAKPEAAETVQTADSGLEEDPSRDVPVEAVKTTLSPDDGGESISEDTPAPSM